MIKIETHTQLPHWIMLMITKIVQLEWHLLHHFIDGLEMLKDAKILWMLFMLDIVMQILEQLYQQMLQLIFHHGEMVISV
jgi:hypothetical protein